eukprot:7097544-Prymnesium_polylepis.1
MHQGEGALREVQRQGPPLQALLGAQRQGLAGVHDRREEDVDHGEAARLPGGKDEHGHDGDRSGDGQVADQ